LSEAYKSGLSKLQKAAQGMHAGSPAGKVIPAIQKAWWLIRNNKQKLAGLTDQKSYVLKLH